MDFMQRLLPDLFSERNGAAQSCWATLLRSRRRSVLGLSEGVTGARSSPQGVVMGEDEVMVHQAQVDVMSKFGCPLFFPQGRFK